MRNEWRETATELLFLVALFAVILYFTKDEQRCLWQGCDDGARVEHVEAGAGISFVEPGK